MDAELEISRQIRDKLGGAVEQWRHGLSLYLIISLKMSKSIREMIIVFFFSNRTSAYLLRTSAKSALAAKESYDLIQISR